MHTRSFFLYQQLPQKGEGRRVTKQAHWSCPPLIGSITNHLLSLKQISDRTHTRLFLCEMKEAWINPWQTSGHSYSSAAGQDGIESADTLPGYLCCDVCWALSVLCWVFLKHCLAVTPSSISGMWWRAPNNWELLEQSELLTDIPPFILGASAG